MYQKIAILYSFEQKAFHTETLIRYCRSNIEASVRKKPHQYRLVGIADNDEDANNKIEQVKKIYNW